MDPLGIRNWESIRRVLSKYAKRHDLIIKVSNPYSNATEPITEPGVLYIYLFTTPIYLGEDIITSAYGIDLDRHQKAYLKPSGLGDPITDPNGVVVAELVGSTLYIYFDLPRGDHAATLMTNIMDSYIQLLATDSEQRHRNQLERTRAAFQTVLTHDLNIRISDNDHRIARTQEHLMTYRQELITLTAELRNLQTNRYVLTASLEAQQAKLSGTFADLVKLDVTGIPLITSQGIKVNVGEIAITYQGVTYLIGEFTIVIDLSDTPRIYCHNRTGNVDGLDHPASSNLTNKVYFGGLSVDIAKLLGENELGMAVRLVVDYLSSPHPENWVTPVHSWPIKVT